MTETAVSFKEKLRRSLSRMDQDLPTIPQVLSQILYLTASEKSSSKDLTRVLAQDQALTARILRVANSAYYGLREKTSTVERAVVVLGFNMIRNLATSATFINWFSHLAQHPNFALDKFWVHATAVGVLADILARERGLAEPGDAFTAGILHDIGKLVLLVYYDQEFTRVLQRVEETEVEFYEAEKAELGVGHDLVAGLLLRNYSLPNHIVSVIRYHHQPWRAGENEAFASCLHLADYTARYFKIGYSGSPYIKPISRKVLKRLNISPRELKNILKRLSEQEERIWDLLEALG